MKMLKTILAVVGAIAVILIALGIFSFLYSALFYVIVLGALAGGGYYGYKLLKSEPERPQLSSQPQPVIVDMEKHDRTLEEYKRKYLPK